MGASTYGDDATVGGGDVTVTAANDTASTLVLSADNSDDAGDDWQVSANADQTLTVGNDIASAGTFAAHVTVTPNSTLANSTTAVAGNLTSGGVFTCNGGVKVDNITIDGTEIDLSSGELTLDVAGNIVLDTGGDVVVAVSGTRLMSFGDASSSIMLTPLVSGKDIEFNTSDGDLAARVDSSDDSFDILRKFKLGADAITSDATLTAANGANTVICSSGAGTVTGTLANPTFTGQFKIIMGASTDGGGAARVTYNSPSSSVTKTMTSGTGIILFGMDLGGGTYRWMLLGDVS